MKSSDRPDGCGGTTPPGSATQRVLKWASLFLGIAPLCVLWCVMLTSHDVTVGVSEDGLHRIVVREGRFRMIDRNFDVQMIDPITGKRTTIFQSRDQSPVISREAFVWSDDSQRVALIGDNYYVIDEARLKNGMYLFLVYDLSTQQVYCNTEYERDLPYVPVEWKREFSNATGDAD